MEYMKQMITNYMQKWSENERFSGTILVSHQNEIIFNQGFGYKNMSEKTNNNINTIYKVGSMSKLYIATCILMLWESSKIKLTDSVDIYLDTYKYSNEVTVHHLLSHTSGIIDHTSIDAYKMEEHMTFEQLIARVNAYQLKFKPGTQFEYSNTNYALLAKIIENVTKKSINNYLEEVLLKPLGLLHTGVCNHHYKTNNFAEGYSYSGEGQIKAKSYDMSGAYGSGFMYANATDVLTFITALFHGDILRKETLELMLKPQVYVWYLNAHAAYGCFISNEITNVITINGMISGFSFNLRHDLKKLESIIILSNNDTTPMNRITEGIAAIMKSNDPKSELFMNKKYYYPNIDRLKDIEGYYKSMYTNAFFNIDIKDKTLYVDRLWAQSYHKAWFRLVCISEEKKELVFICDVCEGTFRFKFDENNHLIEIFYTFDTFTLPFIKSSV